MSRSHRIGGVILAVHLLMMGGIIAFFYFSVGTDIYKKVIDFSNSYLFDNIGVYSPSRPELSKVLMNYIIFMAPITAFIFHFMNLDVLVNVKDKKLGFWGFMVLLLIGAYFTYFNHTYFVASEHIVIKYLRGDSIIGYYSIVSGMFISISHTLPALLKEIL